MQIFDFCTLPMDGLVEWTFRLFDPDGSGVMNKEEFKQMNTVVRKTSFACGAQV